MAILQEEHLVFTFGKSIDYNPYTYVHTDGHPQQYFQNMVNAQSSLIIFMHAPTY